MLFLMLFVRLQQNLKLQLNLSAKLRRRSVRSIALEASEGVPRGGDSTRASGRRCWCEPEKVITCVSFEDYAVFDAFCEVATETQDTLESVSEVKATICSKWPRVKRPKEYRAYIGSTELAWDGRVV